METGYSWERGEGWSKVVKLIELARKSDWSEFNAERKERVLHGVMVGLAQERERRRAVRAFVAGAFVASVCTLLVVGVLLRLIGVDVVALARG